MQWHKYLDRHGNSMTDPDGQRAQRAKSVKRQSSELIKFCLFSKSAYYKHNVVQDVLQLKDIL